MTYAIFKASYNYIGSPDVRGGICGTGFFIQADKALTANHLLSTANYRPNQGYAQCQYWLLSRDGLEAIPILKESVIDHPEIDMTIVDLKQKDVVPSNMLNLSAHSGASLDCVYCQGYIASEGFPPHVQLRWERNKLVVIRPFDLRSVISDKSGYVTSVNSLTLRSQDVNLNQKMVLHLSFGLPKNSPQKTELFAISVEEIRKILRLSG